MSMTRDQFTQLVAELIDAGPLAAPGILADPACTQPVTIADAVELTGLKEDVLRQYERRARLARSRGQAGSHLIPPLADGMWQAGDLAWWTANRKYRSRRMSVPAKPAATWRQRRPLPGNDQYLPAVRAILSVAPGTMNVLGLRERLADQGIRVGWRRAERLFHAAGGLPQLPPLIPDEDGLVGTARLAAHYGVNRKLITEAVADGDLTPAWRAPGKTGAMRFDPATVTRQGLRRCPVDVPAEALTEAQRQRREAQALAEYWRHPLPREAQTGDDEGCA